MVIFNSYVKLPEGNQFGGYQKLFFIKTMTSRG